MGNILILDYISFKYNCQKDLSIAGRMNALSSYNELGFCSSQLFWPEDIYASLGYFDIQWNDIF